MITESIVEADIQFHELVIVKSGWPHCEQIWRTIVPRVRAYFYDDAPHHASLSDIVTEHQELLAVMRTGDDASTALEVERHIRRRPSFGGYGTAPPANTERPPGRAPVATGNAGSRRRRGGTDADGHGRLQVSDSA